MTLTVVILTHNEAYHIERALASIAVIADRTVVIDSGSTDDTVTLAKAAGADVLVHPFVNQAQQFNWGLSQLPADTDWVLRLDADEVITPNLLEEISMKLPVLGTEIAGVYVSRRMTFLRHPIRWGGVFPIRILRLMRFGKGRYENRWMDEQMIVNGPKAVFKGEILDDNSMSLTAWITKHNAYASREVVDILNQKYGFMAHETIADLKSGNPVGVKRWLKEKFYARLPEGMRAFMYFVYRYIVRLGFIDGKEGTAFHVLQAFWYRYLVDMKVHEVRTYMRRNEVDVVDAIRDVLGIDVRI